LARVSGGVAAVTLIAGVVVVRAVGRGWMGRAPAARWIDRRAGLDGRLATLVELPGHSRRAPLFPLLVEQNVVCLAAWEPARIVRRPVPLFALGAAIVACSVLLLLLVLAPRLRPPPPEIVRSDRPVEGMEPADDLDAVPHRMLVASLRGRQGERPGDGDARVATAGADGGRPRAPRVPASIQGAIRRQLWGEAPTPIEIAGLERGQTAGDESADGRRDASVPGEGSGGAGDDRERAGDARPVADDAGRFTEEATEQVLAAARRLRP